MRIDTDNDGKISCADFLRFFAPVSINEDIDIIGQHHLRPTKCYLLQGTAIHQQ